MSTSIGYCNKFSGKTCDESTPDAVKVVFFEAELYEFHPKNAVWNEENRTWEWAEVQDE